MDASKDVKILLPYIDFEDVHQKESVWAEPQGEGRYKIYNIPFFAEDISFGDIVTVTTAPDGMLELDEVVEASGHTAIQMIFFKEEEVLPTGEKLVNMGCGWEGSHLKRYISVDVPPQIPYSPIHTFLVAGQENGIWDFREACLAHND